METRRLQQRVEELEDQLRQEVSDRDRQIKELREQLEDHGWTARVNEFLPHAGVVTQFLETLPALVGAAGHGKEVVAPVWALRCAKRAGGTGDKEAQDKRWLLSVFELFEQLSTGRVTAEDITDTRPLDVYVHRGEDGAWGLYCCSRHRLLALLMRQACARNELLRVKCILRPKDDQSYWGWQWSNFYDGGDGLQVQPHGGPGPRFSIGNGSQTSSRMSLPAGSLCGGGGRSAPSTPRVGRSATSVGRSSGVALGEGVEDMHPARSPRTVQRLSAPATLAAKRAAGPLKAGSGSGGGAGQAKSRGPSGSGMFAPRAKDESAGSLPRPESAPPESTSSSVAVPAESAPVGYPGAPSPMSNVPTVAMSLDLDGDMAVG